MYIWLSLAGQDRFEPEGFTDEVDGEGAEVEEAASVCSEGVAMSKAVAVVDIGALLKKAWG